MKRLLALIAVPVVLVLSLAGPSSPAHAAVWSQVHAANSSWCITADLNTAPGGKVYLYRCYSNPVNQLWADISVSDGGYMLQLDEWYNGQPLCLNNAGGTTNVNVQYTVWYCEFSPVPAWEEIYRADAGGGWYQFLQKGTFNAVTNTGNNDVNLNPITTWYARNPIPSYQEWWRNW